MLIVIRFHTVHGCGSSRKQEINLNEIRKLICSTRLVGPPRQIYFSISWLIKNSTDWGLNERQVTLPCDPSTYSSIQYFYTIKVLQLMHFQALILELQSCA